MKTININMSQITDWESFHKVFSEVMGFPDFYGRNINAWIDCMSDLSTPQVVGMTKIQVPIGDHLVLFMHGVNTFKKRQPEIFNDLMDAVIFVNENKMPIPESSKLILLLA
jgi:RNAse (barnase) inhibitor barstar